MTIFECYNSTKQMLKEAGIENAVFEAKQIIYYITKYTSAQILERYNEQLDEVKRSLWVVTVKQRCTGYPLQYILGEWDFYGLRFFVGEGCLVPRSDTETLVAKALDFLEGKENPDVLDLCAGSGCIGITVANKVKDSRVTLVEKYDVPFHYMQKNAERNAADNCELVCADIFCFEPNKKFDLILSNPPYISADEMSLINREAEHEPEEALYGGEDGLDYYRAILRRYPEYLKDGGMLAVEVGFTQAEAVKELFAQAGFENIGTEKDFGDIQRVVFGTVKAV